MFDETDRADCDEIDETDRAEANEAARRPPDPIAAARAAGRFTPELGTRRPRKRHKRRQYDARGPPADDDADADVDAYSIAAFCRRHNISQSFYHKLRAQGLGPRTMQVGSRVLITKQAARRWRRERERAAAQAD